MTVVEHGYTLEEARDLSQAGLEQCVDKMAAIFGALHCLDRARLTLVLRGRNAHDPSGLSRFTRTTARAVREMVVSRSSRWAALPAAWT